MGEEGSEEEVERSFEEEFASVIAPGEGLEEVLKSLDEEFQEGNWKTRLRKEEVASKRAVLQRARAVLESAVKSREGLPVLDPGSTAKKRQARRYAELAATADAEARDRQSHPMAPARPSHLATSTWSGVRGNQQCHRHCGCQFF